jgi:hypothetical protein
MEVVGILEELVEEGQEGGYLCTSMSTIHILEIMNLTVAVPRFNQVGQEQYSCIIRIMTIQLSI